MTTGTVYLVGAGPGDPGLLTLAAAQALSRADVVVYDALVSPEILAHAAPGAELVFAGKRAGEHYMDQDAIQALLIERAKQGQAVVRLKGGDPFVYGRGGEEALACKEAGVPFVIVPGLSSALAGPAYAGIPVTHRRIAESFAVVTGSSAEGEGSRVADAARSDTVVVLMGVERIEAVCQQLIEGGKNAATPAAAIRWGTRHDQQVVRGTVSTLPALVAEAGLKAPAVIVAGDVVSLSEQLAWFNPGPLAGKRIVVTRARDQASDLSGQFRALGAMVIEAPVIETAFRPAVDLMCVHCEPWDWIVFTSANAVAAVRHALESTGRDVRKLTAKHVAAIGTGTAEALRDFGIVPDFVPGVATAAALAEELPLSGAKRVLYPTSALADDRFETALRQRTAVVRRVDAYDTIAKPLDAQRVRDVLEADAITFTSSSTARFLRDALPGDADIAHAKLVSIGTRTSESVRECFGRVDAEASSPSLEDLVEVTRLVLA